MTCVAVGGWEMWGRGNEEAKGRNGCDHTGPVYLRLILPIARHGLLCTLALSKSTDPPINRPTTQGYRVDAGSDRSIDRSRDPTCVFSTHTELSVEGAAALAKYLYTYAHQQAMRVTDARRPPHSSPDTVVCAVFVFWVPATGILLLTQQRCAHTHKNRNEARWPLPRPPSSIEEMAAPPTPPRPSSRSSRHPRPSRRPRRRRRRPPPRSFSGAWHAWSTGPLSWVRFYED